MPGVFPPTVAEREAELAALQSAFDEYIASSRELEEELDAELAKMQEKLAESTAANAALSAQLENIAPQLTSLENALTQSRHKLKEEQKLRRHAEQAQDEAEQRLREMEQSIQHVREECDVVHEELAFKENELEETRLELEVEKQELQNELARVKGELESTSRKRSLMDSDASKADDTENATLSSKADTTDSVPSVDEAYVKKLEEELELVTEQLIETEKRLSETEGQLQEMQAAVELLQDEGRREEDEELIRQLQTENADLMDSEQKLRDQLDLTKQEYTLAKEEIQLQQEELHASEEDVKNLNMQLEEDMVKHRDEVNKLQIELKEAVINSKASLGEAALVAASVKEANEENAMLQEQIDGMEQALKNAQEDYKSVLEELDAVNARFDAAREEARQEGRDEATEELRAAMRSDVEHEVKGLKDQLAKLTEENTVLQQKVDDTEISLAAVNDSQNRNVQDAAAQSEVVAHLQSQLVRSKEDLAKKDKEMKGLSAELEERVAKAEDTVTQLENDLRSAKAQLAESEAHLIVLKREKESKEYSIPKSPHRNQRTMDKEAAKGMPATPTLSRGRSVDRDELSSMDAEPTPPRGRSGSRRPRSSSPSSVMRMELRLSEEQKKLEDLQKDYDALQDQKRMGEIRIKRLEEDLRTLQKELFSNGGESAVVTQMSRLSSLAAHDKDVDIIADDENKAKRLDDIIESRDVKLMTEELRALEKQFNGQREYNAQLLSKMLHLQGNIQVYCRIRPMTINEIQKGNKSVAESLSETEVGCFDGRTNMWKSFAFDRVWGPDQSQQSVFQDVEPLALSVVDGFNACIFAYGQTGSGKTFTMEGIAQNSQYGISYRTIQKIFHLLKLRAQQQRAAEMFVGSENEDEPAKEIAFTFSIEIGMLEIYNDDVYDLLATEGASRAEKKQQAINAGGKASLEIRRSKDGRIEVPNLTKEKVNDIKDVMELLQRGNANRATACTDMNEHSSRSHMVLSVDVYSGLDDSQRNKGTLFLVDLAGCERVRKSHVDGDQLKEAGFINKSLSALGNVMEALDRKASHVPYRDSKLTYLLQDSLGGNSRTMMVVTINPIDESFDESVNALQFATRVRRIQIGAAQRNVTAKNLEETVKTLTEEMRALTRAKERTEGQLHSLKRDNARVQEKLQNLSKSKSQSRSDSKTLEVLRKNNDDMAARWQREKSAREELSDELEKIRKELRTNQQQFGKSKSKIKMLEQKLEDKERELEHATKQLRQQRNNLSATNIRSRREQVLSARKRQPQGTGLRISTTPTNGSATSSVAKSAAMSDSVAGDSQQNGVDPEVAEIRSKVLELLEKYDKGKVDRIDIIMEKFKGKEQLLLEKMTQRYESGGRSPSASAQQRNEIALQRHKERMRKIREKKAQNGSAKGPTM